MISGVSVRPLRRLRDARGEVRHMLKRTDPGFARFGEVYFSSVNPGYVKAWHIHKRKTLNYAIVYGRARLVLYDERRGSKTFGKLQEIDLHLRKYALVTVPPGVWNGFKCLGSQPALLVNCATLPYDPMDIARVNPFANHIPYDWGRAKGGG